MSTRFSHTRALIELSLLAALGIGSQACGEAGTAGEGTAPEPSKPVEIEVATPADYTSWVHVPGIVEASSSMSLSFRVPGYVHRLEVEEGDRVEAGALLAELDPRDYERDLRVTRAALESADAQAAETQRELERQEQLISSNSTSSQRLESARSAHEVAAAEARQARLGVEAAEVALRDCGLRAPVDGYVESRFVEKHEFAAAQVPVLILTELDKVVVRASVADRSLSAVKLGGRATVRSSAWPDRVFEGRISQVSVAADPLTRTLPFEIEVENPALALRPSMVVKAGIPIEEAKGLLTVPMNAVMRDAGLRPICFVARAEGSGLRAESRPVTLGRLRGDRITIDAGIAAGDRVVVRGQYFLETGDTVHVMDADPVAVSALEQP